MTPRPAISPLSASEDAVEADGYDLNSLIRRRDPVGAGGPRPDILPLALLAKGAQVEVANGTEGHGSTPHAGNGQANGSTVRTSKRRQLTLRLWPDEFDRLRAVATVAHTSYQEVLASAAVIFLDHVLPRGVPADEEIIADGWHRLKNGEL